MKNVKHTILIMSHDEFDVKKTLIRKYNLESNNIALFYYINYAIPCRMNIYKRSWGS